MSRNSFHRVDQPSRFSASPDLHQFSTQEKFTIQLSGKAFNHEVGRLTIGSCPCEVGLPAWPADADTHPIRRVGEAGTGTRRAATLRMTARSQTLSSENGNSTYSAHPFSS